MNTYIKPSKRGANHGSSLIEMLIASTVASVGTLAVFTLFLQWQPYVEQLEHGYQDLNQRHLERPTPLFERRLAVLACEIES